MEPNNNTPLRVEMLNEAARLTAGDRNASYGDPRDNMQNIARLWNAYLENKEQIDGVTDAIWLTPADICHMMALVKMARLQTNPTHVDSGVDQAAYSAMAVEVATEPGMGEGFEYEASPAHLNIMDFLFPPEPSDDECDDECGCPAKSEWENAQDAIQELSEQFPGYTFFVSQGSPDDD